MAISLTWLGHAAFRMDTPGGKRIYVDPFLNGNLKCPESEREPERVDAIFITHGHNDHVGDTLELVKKFECPVVAPVEVRDLIGILGYPAEGPHDPNKGGTVDLDWLKVTLVHAQHSSSFVSEAPAGSERSGRSPTRASRAASSSTSARGRRSISPATRTSSATWR